MRTDNGLDYRLDHTARGTNLQLKNPNGSGNPFSFLAICIDVFIAELAQSEMINELDLFI